MSRPRDPRLPDDGDATIIAQPTPRPGPTRPGTARRPWAVAVAAGLLLVALGAGGWWVRGCAPPGSDKGAALLAAYRRLCPRQISLATALPTGPRAATPDSLAPPADGAAIAAAPAPVSPAPVSPAPVSPAPVSPAGITPPASIAEPPPTRLASLPPATAPSPPTFDQPAFELRAGDEATILANAAARLTLFRVAAAPAIVVLDFPSLLEQGRTLNRVAALVEKAGLPRDRVLDDAELAQAIRARGETAATFYYGHDYPAAALVRFFALADRDHIALDPEEERLRRLLRQLDWLAPGAAGALISVSRAGADADVTEDTRATILHHELAHGAFFTDPRYAAYVRGFWRDRLSRAERAAVRRFLAQGGYDSGDEELMLNEMQAYLMFTHNPAFFAPADVAMSPARRAALEASFHRGLPEGWIRSLPVAPPLASASAVRATLP